MMKTQLEQSVTYEPKCSNKYECLCCDFSSVNKKDYDRHISTRKHQYLVNFNKNQQTGVKKPQPDTLFSCEHCNKKFKERSGLWKHNKNKHPLVEKKEQQELPLFTEMFMELMKQNKELQNQLFEMAKEKSAITNNGTINNNTMNNKFNLNFFLNETCKDAMNIQEFIDFCKVQHADFENFGKYGYVESMTRIIMRNLMELEVHRRPIHCTDAKREVLYVKDNNVWVNDFSREKLIRAIKYIAAKNVKQIPGWMDHNPDSKNTQTKLHDKYMRMVCHSMGGRDEAEDQEYYKKIIRNVAKEVIIDKMK